MIDGVGAVDEEGECERRDRYDDPRPDGEPEAARDLVARAARDHIADRPRQAGKDDDHQGQQPGRARVAGDQHRQAHQADADTDQLLSGGPLVEEHARDRDREDHLHLNEQRGKAGRHAQVQRQVQEPELTEAHEQADLQDRPPRTGARHEEDRREQHDEEPRTQQQEGREALQALVDDDEVGAPDDCDKRSPEVVATSHLC